MDMLKELLVKKKLRDQKLSKEQIKPKESNNNRPLPRLLDFFKDRQEVRLGVLYSLRSKNQLVEEPVIEKEVKKVNVSYIC